MMPLHWHKHHHQLGSSELGRFVAVNGWAVAHNAHDVATLPFWPKQVHTGCSSLVPWPQLRGAAAQQHLPAMQDQGRHDLAAATANAEALGQQVEEACGVHGHAVEQLGCPNAQPLLHLQSIEDCIVQGVSDDAVQVCPGGRVGSQLRTAMI